MTLGVGTATGAQGGRGLGAGQLVEGGVGDTHAQRESWASVLAPRGLSGIVTGTRDSTWDTSRPQDDLCPHH